MGRWRPPPPTSSPYITAAGFERLQVELDGLWPRRRDVVAALSVAAAEGDRSENAEYIYRKKELAGIDRRIRYLQKRMPSLQVVDAAPGTDRAYFGAYVRLLTDDGSDVAYRIVGPDETDAKKGWISVDAPLARALLGKSTGDEITLALGDRETSYEVIDIRYGPDDDV